MKDDHQGHIENQAQRIAYLIAAYIQQTITKQEHDELDEWVAASDENMMLFEELTDEKNLSKQLARMEQFDKKAALQNIQRQIEFKKPRRKRVYLRLWHYAAAASVVTLAVLGSIYLLPSKRIPEGDWKIILADIEPGSKKAILTLSNGKRIILDTADRGVVKDENGATINKTENGTISYDAAHASQVSYNIVSTPRGGEYQVILSDGSKVWLNAASSLRFPTWFNEKTRSVELTGEAYFEVAKNPNQPFTVSFRDAQVKVLGTMFNVNTYDQEKSHTTLIEGSVELVTKDSRKHLNPGEQAVTGKANTISLNAMVDLDEVTAWKNGNFHFVDADLNQIMREVSRWYDVDVETEADIIQHFNATIPRDVPLSKLLKLLELTNHVKFKVDGKKITVMQ